nr:transposase [Klebsiella sp. S69]
MRPAHLRSQLNQHSHIHLSVTRGGLNIKHGVWRDLFFKKHAVEEIWRGAVIRLLRHSYNLINPGSLPGLGHIHDNRQWQRYLQAQYERHWKVHFAKKTRGACHSVKYLGRYLKRPSVSAAKLRHDSGSAVVHNYYDHRTQQYRQQTLTHEDMVGRYISHIPAKHFKMVRYYSFLSNHKRGTLLPKVYEALQMEERKTGTTGLRRADEGVPAHRSVQMHPVRQQTALQQCTGRQARVGISGRKAAQYRPETIASGPARRVSSSKKWV